MKRAWAQKQKQSKRPAGNSDMEARQAFATTFYPRQKVSEYVRVCVCDELVLCIRIEAEAGG